MLLEENYGFINKAMRACSMRKTVFLLTTGENLDPNTPKTKVGRN